MSKYFLICASRDHVIKGIEGGFAQAGHRRKDFMSKPSKGDWVIYYSAKDKFENGKPLQKFTAIGQVIDDEPYQPNAHSDFKPYRRNVTFKESQETDIRSLIEKLNFIKTKKRWGFYLISGFREISKRLRSYKPCDEIGERTTRGVELLGQDLVSFGCSTSFIFCSGWRAYNLMNRCIRGPYVQ